MIKKKLVSCKRLHIGLDFDNTLVRFRRSALREAYHKLGYKRAKFSIDYHFRDVPEEVRVEIWKCFEDLEYMFDITIIPGVVGKLREWKTAGHKLTVITARGKTLRTRTLEFIAENFPEVSDTYFVDMGVSKANLFRQTGIQVWVDDNPQDTIQAAKMGIHTCLICNSHTPYNQFIKGDHMLHTYARVADINFT